MSRHRMGCICEQRLKRRPCRGAVLWHLHVPRQRLGQKGTRRLRPRAGPRADADDADDADAAGHEAHARIDLDATIYIATRPPLLEQ